MNKVVRFAFSLIAVCTLCVLSLSSAKAQWVQESLTLGSGSAGFYPNVPSSGLSASYGSNTAGNEIHAYAHAIGNFGPNQDEIYEAGATAYYTVKFRYSGTTPTPSFNLSVSEVVTGVMTIDYHAPEAYVGAASTAGTLNGSGDLPEGTGDYGINRTYVMEVQADQNDPFVAYVTFSVNVRASLDCWIDPDPKGYFKGETTANASVTWGTPY